VARDRWLVSYTDMVTILLILFVAIAAQTIRGNAPPKPPDPPPPPPPVQQPRALAMVQQKLASSGLDLRLDDRGLTISLPQAILFPSGEDRVMPDALPVLSHIAGELADIPNRVALVGHADAVPIHTQRFRSNWELSAARSLNLLTLLKEQYGIAESRLSVQSYGSNSPRSSNDTEEGRSENRRVEILIMEEPPHLDR
jgi:chemotaxis protein MotB